jgi:putative tryptophan/tyrosine transport system substrate-binding protein
MNIINQKNHKVLIRIIIIIVIISIAFNYFILSRTQIDAKKAIAIGLIQTASHPVFDQVRNGFEYSIHKHMPTAHIFFNNMQLDVSAAHAIAQRLHADNNIVLIGALGTPALMAIANLEKTKPIVFAAITHYKPLGFVRPDSNVTGCTDMINVDDMIELLQRLVPHAQKVGILLSAIEPGARVIADLMKHALQLVHIDSYEIMVVQGSEIFAAGEVLFNTVDAIIVPQDNTIALSIRDIAAQAIQARIPLIVSNNALVEHGALAAIGVDYYDLGKRAGMLAVDIVVHGKKPDELPVVQADLSTIVINKDTAQALDMTLPEDIVRIAKIVRTVKG